MGAIGFKGTKLDPATIKALVSGTLVNGSRPSVWWARQSQSFRDLFMDTMRTSMRNGESLTQAATRVFGGTVDGVTTPGIMKATKAQASALAATSISAVTNEAALASFQANSDVIKAFVQLSTLDNKTSDICVAYSGQMWDINTLQSIPFPPGAPTLPFNGGPPRHFNCRSRLRPVTKSFKELGLDIEEFPVSTRASMDGQVPADISFSDFLKSKPTSFADKLLGPKRANLWRNGDINLTQLVDFRGNPMTLAQLEQRLGIPPKVNPLAKVTPPKPKMVDGWLKNDDGTFIQISEVERANIRAHAKRLVSAAEDADVMVTKQIKALADDVGAKFPDAAIVKDGPLVEEGSLHWRMKDLDSTSRKIQTYARDRGLTFDQAAEQISDSLRYTYVLSEDEYIKAIQEAMQKFAELGYKNNKFDPAWLLRPDYKGLNINLVSPQGVRMELQFHTSQSFYVKDKLNHVLYEEFRVLSKAKQLGPEGQALQAEMLANAQAIPVPKNIQFLEDLAKIYNKPDVAKQAEIWAQAKGRQLAAEQAFAETQAFNSEVAIALKDGNYLLARKTILDAGDMIPDTVKKSATQRIEQVRKDSAKKADSLIAEKKFTDIKNKDDFNGAFLDLLDEMDAKNIDKAVRLEVTDKLKTLKKVKLEDFATEDVMFHQVMGNFDDALKAAATIENPSPTFIKLIEEVKLDKITSTEKKVRLALENGKSDDAIKVLMKFGDTEDAPTIKALHKEIQTGTKLSNDTVSAIEEFVAKDMDEFSAFVKTKINTDDMPGWVRNRILNDPDFAIAEENAKWAVQVKNIEKQLIEGKVDDALAAINAVPDTIYNKQKLKFAIETAKKKKDDIIKVEFPKKVKDIAINELGFKANDLLLISDKIDEWATLLDGVVNEQFKVGLKKQLSLQRLILDDSLKTVKSLNQTSKGVDAITGYANSKTFAIRSHPEFQAAIKKATAQAAKKAKVARATVKKELVIKEGFEFEELDKYAFIIDDALKDVNKKLGPQQFKAKITEIKAKIAQAKNGNVNITPFIEDLTEYDEIVNKVLGVHTKQQLDDAVALFKANANDASARSKLFDTLGNASTDQERRAIKEYVHARVNPKTLPNGMNFDQVVAQIVSKHANNASASDIQTYIKAMLKGGDADLKINFEQTIFTRANVKNIDFLGVTPEGEITPAVERILAELKKKGGDKSKIPITEHTPAEMLDAAKHWLHFSSKTDAEFRKSIKQRSKGIVQSGHSAIRRGDQLFGKNSWGITEEEWAVWVKNVAPTLDDWDISLISQYTGGMAGQINAGLFNGGVEFYNTAGARALNTALDKMPKHKGQVFRGTHNRDHWTADYVDARYEVGKTVVERGFGSSATQEAAAFNGPIKFVIKTNGTQGAIIGHLGGYGAKEMEVLFKAGSKFRVVRKRRNGTNGITVWMEEI